VTAAARGRSWRFWALVAGVAAAALGTVLALVLIAPWSSSSRSIRHALYQHILLAAHTPPAARVDLKTGRSIQFETSNEIWYDTRTGLYRLQLREGPHVVFDGVGTSCPPVVSTNACVRIAHLSPFMESDGWSSSFDQGKTHNLGKGTVDGHRVVWVALSQPPKGNLRERAALDAETHELRAVRQFVNGRPLAQENVTLLSDLPAGSIGFPVPRGGAPWNGVPPLLTTEMDLGPTDIRAVRHALTPSPLWVGRRFAGLRLDTIESGRAKTRGVNGALLSSVPYVRISYGGPGRQLVIEEFNPSSRAVLRNQTFNPPPVGFLDLAEGERSGRLIHGGVAVRIEAPRPQLVIDAARALSRIPAKG
jgi:hypothetical protein